jgi:hypothetical protein
MDAKNQTPTTSVFGTLMVPCWPTPESFFSMACLGGRVTPRAQAKRFHVLAMLLVKVSWRRTLLRLFFFSSRLFVLIKPETRAKQFHLLVNKSNALLCAS